MSSPYKKGVFKKGMVVCWRQYVYRSSPTDPASYEIKTGIVTALYARFIKVAVDGGDKEVEVAKDGAFPIHPSVIAYFNALDEDWKLSVKESEEMRLAQEAVRNKWLPQRRAAKDLASSMWATIPDEYKGR